jgi:hypothetical protein
MSNKIPKHLRNLVKGERPKSNGPWPITVKADASERCTCCKTRPQATRSAYCVECNRACCPQMDHDDPCAVPRYEALHPPSFPEVTLKLDAHATWALRSWFAMVRKLDGEDHGWTQREVVGVARFLDGEALERLARKLLIAFKEQRPDLLTHPGEPKREWVVAGEERERDLPKSIVAELAADLVDDRSPIPVAVPAHGSRKARRAPPPKGGGSKASRGRGSGKRAK